MDYERDKHYDEKYCRRNTRGIAIGGLVTGIAGSVLGGAALMKRKGGLFGGCEGVPPVMGYPGYGGCEPYSAQAEDIYLDNKIDRAKDKECEDVLALTRADACIEKEIGNKALFLQKEIFEGDLCNKEQTWALAFKLQKEICEQGKCLDKEIDRVAAKEQVDVLNLYRNLDAVAFKSYKEAKEGDDCLAVRISNLEKENAVLAAVTKCNKETEILRDIILDEKIKKVALLAKFDLEREMCKVVKGEVVLPLTPTVTGVPSLACCRQIVAAADAAATTTTATA